MAYFKQLNITLALMHQARICHGSEHVFGRGTSCIGLLVFHDPSKTLAL